MSRSRNTVPYKYKVQRKQKENEDVVLPKIIIRKPHNEDIHPLNRKDIVAFLKQLPKEYLYKLKVIELKARMDKPGQPYGTYYPVEQKVILYSHPLKAEYDLLMALAFAFMEEKGETIPGNYYIEDDKLFAEWSFEELKKLYLDEVLSHELGHHYYHINKKRRKLPQSRFHEILANLYSDKINSTLSGEDIKKMLTTVK